MVLLLQLSRHQINIFLNEDDDNNDDDDDVDDIDDEVEWWKE